MIDTSLIRKKLGELETYIITLERLRSHSLQELLEDRAKATWHHTDSFFTIYTRHGRFQKYTGS